MRTDGQSKPQNELIKERIFTADFINIIIADLSLRICSFMQVALVPLFVLENGYSTTFAGLTMSVFMLMSVISRPVSGRMVDKKGRYVVIIIGSVIYCFATSLYLFPFPIWTMVLIRILQGLGFSFTTTGLMTLATDLIPESRMSEGIGYLGLTQTISQVFAPALALMVINSYGYHTAFLLLFIVTVFNLFLRLKLRSADKYQKAGVEEEIQESSSLLQKQGTKNSILSRIICIDSLHPSLLMVTVTFAFSGVSTFLLAYASQQAIENPGLFFSVSAFALATTRISVGKIHNKYGSAAVLIPGFSFLLIGYLGIFISSNLPVLLIAGVFYGFGMGALIPEINSLAVLSASKENRGLANSTLFMAMDLGMAIGAFTLGAFANFAGLGAVFLVCAGILLIALLAYIILRKRNFWGDYADN